MRASQRAAKPKAGAKRTRPRTRSGRRATAGARARIASTMASMPVTVMCVKSGARSGISSAMPCAAIRPRKNCGACDDGMGPGTCNPNPCGGATTSTTRTTTTSTTTTTTTSTSTTSTTCPQPATGQTTCWDSSGTVIPCAGTGHDGDIQAGAPLAYTDNGDGTITDNNTGLVWEKQSSDGSAHDVGNTYTWDQAFSGHAATLNTMSFAGHTDWRVPNVRELQSIANYQNFNPAVSPPFNTSCTASCTVLTCSNNYWSSSSYDSFPTDAWGVNFNVGNVNAFSTSSNF